MNQLYNYRVYLILIYIFNLAGCYKSSPHSIPIKKNNVPLYSLKMRAKASDRLSVELVTETLTIQGKLVEPLAEIAHSKIKINNFSIKGIYRAIDSERFVFSITSGFSYVDSSFLFTDKRNAVKFDSSMKGFDIGAELHYQFHPRATLLYSHNISTKTYETKHIEHGLYLNIDIYKNMSLDIGYQTKTLKLGPDNQDFNTKNLEQCATPCVLGEFYKEHPLGTALEVNAQGPKIGLRYQF